MLRASLIQVLQKADIPIVSWGRVPELYEFFTIVRPAGVVNLREQGNVYVVGRMYGADLGGVDAGLQEFALKVFHVLRQSQEVQNIQMVPAQDLRFDEDKAYDRPAMLITCEALSRAAVLSLNAE